MVKQKSMHSLDCSGHLCPVPITMTEEKMGEMAQGQILEVIFTDPGAKPDLQMWCRVHKHIFLEYKREKTKHFATIKKTG